MDDRRARGIRVLELDRDGGLIGRLLADARAAEAPRTGLHVSTVIRDKLRMLEPRKYGVQGAPIGTTGLAFQEVGNVLEDIVSAGLRARIRGWVKPDPRAHHGLIGSPDGYRARTRTIDEIKATWVKASTFLDSMKLRAYLWQLLFYMEAWDADRGLLHVLFVCGNYGPPSPIPQTFVVRASRRAKCENREALVQHARDKGWL